MKLQEAQHIAQELIRNLQPFCELITTAGSIRREVAEVKDIEIVCLPKIIVLNDLFGWDEGEIRNFDFIRYANSFTGDVIKGNAEGRYMQIKLPQQINLDLFMPSKDDYYRQFAIRTGSKKYSQHTIATGWLNKRWCGSDKGLRLITDCQQIKFQNGNTNEWRTKWVCINPAAQLPPKWDSEKDFFKWLNIKWIEPKFRN